MKRSVCLKEVRFRWGISEEDKVKFNRGARERQQQQQQLIGTLAHSHWGKTSSMH